MFFIYAILSLNHENVYLYLWQCVIFTGRRFFVLARLLSLDSASPSSFFRLSVFTSVSPSLLPCFHLKQMDHFSTRVDLSCNPKLRTRNTIVRYSDRCTTNEIELQILEEDLNSISSRITTDCTAKILREDTGFAVCFQYPDQQNKPDYKLSRYSLPRFNVVEARTIPDNQKHLCADHFQNPLSIVNYRGIVKAKRKAPVKKETLNQNKKQSVETNVGTIVVNTSGIADSTTGLENLTQIDNMQFNDANTESEIGATDPAYSKENSNEEINAQRTCTQVGDMASQIEDLKQQHAKDEALITELQSRNQVLEQLYEDEQQIQGDLQNSLARLQQDYHDLQAQIQQVDRLNKELSTNVNSKSSFDTDRHPNSFG